MDATTILAGRIRIAREARSISQDDAAKHLGIPRPSLTLMESGKRRIQALELASLSRLYGVAVASFLEGL